MTRLNFVIYIGLLLKKHVLWYYNESEQDILYYFWYAW